MTVTAYIPARISSERLKRKVLKDFNGRPLLQVLLDKIDSVKLVDQWVVNTESEEIESFVTNQGRTTYKRPEFLANSSTTTEEILADFAKNFKIETEFIAVINPTTPMIRAHTIDKIISDCISNNYDTAFSVNIIRRHAVMNGRPINYSSFGPHPRTQDLDPIYVFNWAVVMWRTELVRHHIRKRGDSLYLGKVGFVPIPEDESIDIDDESDFEFARMLDSMKLK